MLCSDQSLCRTVGANLIGLGLGEGVSLANSSSSSSSSSSSLSVSAPAGNDGGSASGLPLLF